MQPRYRMGHAIALAYIVMGICASACYMWYCKAENKKRAAGLRDETYLMDESQAKHDTPEARAERVERAAGMRRQRVAELKQQGLTGKFKALLASVDELGGGVYADVDDARLHKGDAWSGFRESGPPRWRLSRAYRRHFGLLCRIPPLSSVMQLWFGAIHSN